MFLKYNVLNIIIFIILIIKYIFDFYSKIWCETNNNVQFLKFLEYLKKKKKKKNI